MKEGQLNLERELKRLFGFDSFRPSQREAIQHLLNGEDTIAVLPTGAGKSLLYQFPSALYESGCTIVISPLIALMQDQVERLSQIGIPSMYCNSTQDSLEQRTALSRAYTGRIRMIYVSPERALSESFLQIAKSTKINLVAVDEAHCVSQWGEDFRPDYRRLAKLRTILNGEPPWLAVTATATGRVIEEITRHLKMKGAAILRDSFARPNLKLSVRHPAREPDRKSLLDELLTKRGFLIPAGSKPGGNGRAIVYCATRKTVDSLYEHFSKEHGRLGRYHAGMGEASRKKNQNAFLTGRIDLLFATEAFGMGIDAPDVRLIVHFNLPGSVESYYQEAGRAGRDGNEAECILLYRSADVALRKMMVRKQKNREELLDLLKRAQHYALSDGCRQQHICSYFGDITQPCGICDICTGAKSDSDRARALHEYELKLAKEPAACDPLSDADREILLSHIREIGGAAGRTAIVRELTSKRKNRSGFTGALKGVPAGSILRTIDACVKEGILKSVGKKYPKIAHADIETKTAPRKSRRSGAGTDPKRELIRLLTNYRDREARNRKWKKYMVLQNAVIREIADTQPITSAELRAIPGIGETKIARFGEDIIEIVRNLNSTAPR